MRICFYHGYRDIVGGLTSLYITLLKEMVKRETGVVLFHYYDGNIVRELGDLGKEFTLIDLDELAAKKISSPVHQDDVFLVTGFAEQFRQFFPVNPKVLFYNIGDFLCDISHYKWGINPKFLAKKLINRMEQKKGVVFMDDIGVRAAQERLGLAIAEPHYLPLPVTVPSENLYLRNATDRQGTLRITYIGRSVDWKILPLKRILEHLQQSGAAAWNRIVFSIVVDSVREMQKWFDLAQFQRIENVQVNVFENIRPSEVNDFLLEHSDLHFGMGTSALESGKLGIPTILMDFGTQKFPINYRYGWLYNTRLFRLGESAEINYAPSSQTMEMAVLIELMRSPEFVTAQSEQTYQYVREAHSAEAVTDALIEFAKQTCFRFSEAKPYILYYNSFHQALKRISKAV